jgi:hypothetical protein
MSGNVDTAFVDRADIVQYIGLPPRAAVYGILGSLLQELMSKGIVATAVSILLLTRTVSLFLIFIFLECPASR